MRTTKAAAWLLGVIVFVTVAGSTAQAEAQYAQPHKNFFVGAGLGFGATFEGGFAYFRLEQSVGYRVLNVGDHPGLWVAFNLVESIRSVVALTMAGRVGFDIAVWRSSDMMVTVTPSVGAGLGLMFDNSFGSQVHPAFVLMPAVEAGLTMLDGLLTIWYRPLGFDIFIRDFGFGAYQMMAGVNLNF